MGTDTPGLSQEKLVVAVAVMAELKGVNLLRVIPLVMWSTLPFNKSFSNLISAKMVR